jgi:hypothetical protein
MRVRQSSGKRKAHFHPESKLFCKLFQKAMLPLGYPAGLLSFLHIVLCHAEPVYPELVEGKHYFENRSSFLILHLVLVIPPFALMQKVEPKNQGKPEPLRASCHPRTAAVVIVFIIHLRCSKKHESLLLITFSKGHASPLGATNHRRCIPLCFS